MHVTHLALQSWRNFTSVDVDLQQRVFVAGPNAAGKSNLLDALRFLRDLTLPGGGLQKAIIDRGGVSKLRCLAARRRPAVTIDATIGDAQEPNKWRYRVTFTQDSQKNPLIKEERVERSGKVLLQRPDRFDTQDKERLRQTHLEQVNTNKQFRDLYEFFSSIAYVHILPQLVRQPAQFRHGSLTNDTYGGDLLERIARSQPRIRDSRLKRIGDALHFAVPQLGELKLDKDELGIPHLRARHDHWRPNAGWQREDQFSDGTLRLMALLWAIMDGTGPLLLEEPELSLHPAVVRVLPQMLHRATSKARRVKRQTFISTHSPELLDDQGIAADEVLLLRPDKNGTKVELASADEEIVSLLDRGESIAGAALPRTAPSDVNQLMMFEG